MNKSTLKGGEFLIKDEPANSVFIPEEFSEEQKMFSDMASHFLKSRVWPNVVKIDKHEDPGLMVKLLEEAGAFAIVLELVPREVAEIITKELKISTIGIGAGAQCDIQVLVLHDLVGMTFGRQPRFVRQYSSVRDVMTEAIQNWSNDVKNGTYPNEKESYGLTEETKKELEIG